MSIFSTSHFRIKIEDAPTNQKKKKKNLKTLSGFQQVCTTLKQQVVVQGGMGLRRWQAHLSEGPEFPRFLKELCAPKNANPSSDPSYSSATQEPGAARARQQWGISGPPQTHWTEPSWDRSPEGPRWPLTLGRQAGALSEHDKVITGLTVTLTKQTLPWDLLPTLGNTLTWDFDL